MAYRGGRGRRRGWTGYVLSFLLGAFLALLGYAYYSHLAGDKPRASGTLSKKAPLAEKGVQRQIPDSSSLKKEGDKPPSPQASPRPKIAIVIDDLGGEDKISKELLLFDVPVTFSILPFTPYSRVLATEAHLKGKEVILHLPMEPHGYPKVKPGKGALLEEMNEERLLQQLTRDIASVPNIKGVSNHMGSRLMEDPEKLKIIFSDLKQRGLFFLDSRTTPQSAGLRTARSVGLKALERTLFIDHSPEEDNIHEKLEHLIHSSLSTGMAIGIGHPHAATVRAIHEIVPRMKERGIEIVLLSALIDESPNSKHR
jgi:polysaccharide deacetylase 2 family uncharacterized protein YibQ